MKKYLLVCTLLIAACGKNSNPVTPQPQQPTPGLPTTARYIPNWYNNDTLYGQLEDINGNLTGQYDTLITRTVNDTSMIIHRGVKYYIWWNSLAATDTFKADQLQYSNLSISTKPDTTGVISKGFINSASPHKYKNQQGGTSHQMQKVMINVRANTPFAFTWNGFYMSNRTY